MERLTASNYRSLVESYSAVYDEDLRSQLNEEQQIQEFLEVVDALLEEGYDLSKYTYDELYEDWKSQLGAYAVKTAQKYIPRAIELGKKGVKGVLKIPSTGTKTIVKGVLKPLQSKLGSAAATLAGAEAVLAGEKSLVRKGLGKAGEGITALGKAVYGDKEPATAKPQPSKPEDTKKSAWDKLESVDLFDLVKGHLLDEGYADTEEAALAIMANMSEEWKQSIVEQRVDVGGGRTVGPVAGAVHSLITGNLPKSRTYVPPSTQTPTNRAPSIPASKGDSGKLTDFGAGGGKEKMKKTGMTVGQVERQGRMNRGDYSG
jgi:hypothetical protein